MEIRIGNAGDAAAIARFQVEMALESEGLQLDLGTLQKGVNAAMSDPNKGTYVVAEADGKAVASLMLTREWSDWNNCWYWWIQSVYVSPEYRRKGVYRAMYAKVKEMAAKEGVAQVRLYVDRTNLRGQRTYQSLGMQESHYLMYEESISSK